MNSIDDLWHSREQASFKLTEECPEVLAVLRELFNLLDECARALYTVDSAFSRVSALTVAKSRNLALGCYSLALDSLAQESGALFRVLVETLELLKYFRLYPNRVDEAIENGLPRAGKIAQLIGSEHKGLREYLNEFASHLSLGPQAIRHLLDFNSEPLAELKMQQTFRLPVVLFNLQVLYCFLFLVVTEAVCCMQVAGGVKHSDLAQRIEDLRHRGLITFDEAICKAENPAIPNGRL